MIGRKACRSSFGRLGLGVWVVLASAALPAGAADLNGFFAKAGEGDLALSLSTESYDHFWLGTRLTSVPPVGKVTTKSASLWMRYAFTDRFQVVADLSYVDVDSNGTGGFADKGLQDVTAFAMYRLFESESAGGVRQSLSVAAGIRTPLSNYVGDAPVSLGDAGTDGLLRLVYQVEVGSFYASQQIGFDARGDDPPNGFPLYTELGYTFGRATVGGFYIDYIADGGSDIGDPGFTFPGNQEELQRVGAKAYVRLTERIGASASGFKTLEGRNTGDTTGVSIGLVTHF